MSCVNSTELLWTDIRNFLIAHHKLNEDTTELKVDVKFCSPLFIDVYISAYKEELNEMGCYFNS